MGGFGASPFGDMGGGRMGGGGRARSVFSGGGPHGMMFSSFNGGEDMEGMEDPFGRPSAPVRPRRTVQVWRSLPSSFSPSFSMTAAHGA
jgi:hypothetical protein